MVKLNPIAALSLSLSFCLSLSAWATTPASTSQQASASSSTGSGSGSDLGSRLQAYFADSKKQLGTLEVWQQKLFDEEAVPEYQRYIRGYRFSNTTPKAGAPAVVADIDFDSLKLFLQFYAPKSLKREKPQIMVMLRPQQGCSKCTTSVLPIKALVTERLERRGFKIVWASASELSESKPSAEELQTEAAALALKKNAVGALVLSWQNALEDADASHPDTRHFSIRSLMDIRDVSKSQAQLELIETGSFERSAGKLLSDAFTELGARTINLEISQSEIRREEMVVSVSGVQTFAQYQQVKEGLQGSLKNATLEDQKFARGRVVFAVFSDGNTAKLKDMLSAAKINGMKLGGATIDGNEVHLDYVADAPVAPAAPAASAPAAPAPAEVKKGDPEA